MVLFTFCDYFKYRSLRFSPPGPDVKNTGGKARKIWIRNFGDEERGFFLTFTSRAHNPSSSARAHIFPPIPSSAAGRPLSLPPRPSPLPNPAVVDRARAQSLLLTQVGCHSPPRSRAPSRAPPCCRPLDPLPQIHRSH